MSPTKPDDKADARQSPSVWRRMVGLYVDGFRNMGPVGRSLWVLILVKLVILFFVFKLFFFPDKLSRDYDNDSDRAAAVRESMLDPRR